jgi:hypothetical protein
MRNNAGRIGRWEADGHFRSLDALKAKIEDWRNRGLVGCHDAVDRTTPLPCTFRVDEDTGPAARYTPEQVQEYLDEIREQVCSRCIEKPPGGPPCEPLGKVCGLELHLPDFVKAVHEVDSRFIAPYQEHNRCAICAGCEHQGASCCPCPMDYLLVLAVQAIETVDERHRSPALSGV